MQSRGKSVIEKPRTFLGFQMNELHASNESESEGRENWLLQISQEAPLHDSFEDSVLINSFVS